MAIPEGAYRVHYGVRCFNDMLAEPVDVSIGFTVDLHGTPVQADAAARAAAEAAIASLQGAFPHVPVTGTRYYDRSATGDPWPAPAEEPPAATEG